MARRALLIANGSFHNAAIPALHSPVSDAHRLAALLRREDVGGFEVELAENKTSAELRVAVLKFFNAAGTGDQTILFFSGHGDKNADGQLYLNTSDTEPELLEATALPARYVIDRAQKSLSKQTLFFIDCCYSGAFAASLGVKAVTQTLARDDFAVEGSRGIAVITASAGLQPAREDVSDGKSESLFTRHLIDGIATGAADAANSGKITIANLFHYVRDQLRQAGAKQEPRNFLFGLDGSEPVALNPAKPANPLPPELLAQCELERWQDRQMAATELAGLAASDASLKPHIAPVLEKLAADPDDRVKAFAKHYLSALGPQEEAAGIAHPAKQTGKFPTQSMGAPSSPSDIIKQSERLVQNISTNGFRSRAEVFSNTRDSKFSKANYVALFTVFLIFSLIASMAFWRTQRPERSTLPDASSAVPTPRIILPTVGKSPADAALPADAAAPPSPEALVAADEEMKK